MDKHIILASASPRRQELLSKLGINFSIEPSCIDEQINLALDFGQLAADVALQKAESVAKNYNEGLILGADTIVVIGDEILGKPNSHKEAKEMLSSLSGKWHKVYTGMALIDACTKQRLIDFEESKVKFKELNEDEIQNYIKTGEPMDKAGSYGIQDKGALLIEKIEGCYYNIVGLPLFKLNLMLRNFDLEIL